MWNFSALARQLIDFSLDVGTVESEVSLFLNQSRLTNLRCFES